MNCPLNNGLKKAKRVRSAFTTDQIHGLEKEFKKFPYIGVVNRKEIAKSLNISERAVKIWFQNRRMKEKRDAFQKEFRNYDQIQINAKKFVNDQLNNVNTMKSNDERNLNSTLLQSHSKTSFNKLGVLDLIENHERNENENKSKDDVVPSHYFQNNTVTSSTNESNTTGEFSIQLLKKYKNNLRPCATKQKSRQIISAQTKNNVTPQIKNNQMPRRNDVIPQGRNNVVPLVRNNVVSQVKNDVPRVGYNFPQLRNSVVQQVRNNIIPRLRKTVHPQVKNISTENCKTHGKNKKCQEACRSSHAMSSGQEQKFAKFPSGYVQLYPQNCYPPSCMSAGILWKPIDPADLSAAMPMNDFSMIPNAQNLSIPVSQPMNMQRNKCLCNCYNMNHPSNTATFPRERTSKLQYVIAIPFHETPAHFSAQN
ncbi:unnamed protein product [Parnassius mnemosyne]